jgi:hypothetical protein
VDVVPMAVPMAVPMWWLFLLYFLVVGVGKGGGGEGCWIG